MPILTTHVDRSPAQLLLPTSPVSAHAQLVNRGYERATDTEMALRARPLMDGNSLQ